jgi:tetratricopeptide (TPR) repeat protein
MIRAVASALVVLVLLGAAPAVHADDVAEAKARFRRGAELYRASRWREAIAEFEAAYRLKPHGAIHFNVAQCRERLGEWAGALRGYHDYLREVPDAKDRAAVQASIRGIEERLSVLVRPNISLVIDPLTRTSSF